MKNETKESFDSFSDVKEETVKVNIKLTGELVEGVKFNRTSQNIQVNKWKN